MHFLRKARGPRVTLEKPRLCRKFRKSKDRILPYGDVEVLIPGTKLIKLPGKFKVFEKGKEVPSSGEFYITLETLDPHHLITDVFPSS